MAMKTHKAVKATGRLYAYGSTRYSSKGSKKSHATLKAMGAIGAGAVAGGAVGGGLGALTRNAQVAHVSTNVGSSMGAVAGRRYAAKKGYVRRTKQSWSRRKLNSPHFKPDPAFGNNAKTAIRSSRPTPTQTKGRVQKKGY